MITREVVTYFNGDLLHTQPLSNAEYDTIQWDWHKEVDSLYKEAMAIHELANFTRAMGELCTDYLCDQSTAQRTDR